MRYAYGTTRFVFCVGDVAIKVARIKIAYWVFRLWNRALRGAPKPEPECGTLSAEPKSLARVKHLFAGVTANLEEARMHAQYPFLPVAPTLFSFFGFVNIQARGIPIMKEDLVLCPFRELAHIQSGGITLNQIENFGRVDGKIVLLDCGFEGLNHLLEGYAETLQVIYAH